MRKIIEENVNYSIFLVKHFVKGEYSNTKISLIFINFLKTTKIKNIINH